MKKLVMVMVLMLGTLAFGRDYEYNENRDIVKPIEKQQDRLSRYTQMEWKLDQGITEGNFERYAEFHRELASSDQGENSNR